MLLKMKKVTACVPLWVAAAALILLAAEAEAEAAAESMAACNPLELSPCLPAMSSPAQTPTDTCCRNLRAQTPCFCGYMRNPAYHQYVTSPGAQRVVDACGIAAPKC